LSGNPHRPVTLNRAAQLQNGSGWGGRRAGAPAAADAPLAPWKAPCVAMSSRALFCQVCRPSLSQASRFVPSFSCRSFSKARA
jgi:hypothetical protein